MSRTPRILLVEDNPVIRDLLRLGLREFASVEAVTTVQDALRRAKVQAPDLVISDYRMPAESGLELLSRMREADVEPAFILLATREDVEGPLTRYAAQVDDLLVKPFFVEEAVARIRRVLDALPLGDGQEQRSA